ncbi:calcium-binding protein, partial [Vibrio campbellii]|uniref:calcium-binding protein n=1 Tax=Vibrio campbellii TaxID=680 RepID=UPI001BD9BF81
MPKSPTAPGSPLILDLDGDGIETTDLESGVYFDHDGDGKRERSAFVGPDDGLLVLDVDGDGAITSGNELFGNNTKLGDGTFASNGFTALSQYDENGDGLIDSKDPIFSQLKVFRDLNQDGISQSEELRSLNHHGVTSLKVTYNDSPYVDENGNEHRQQSSYTKSDGRKNDLNDVWFQMEKSDFIYPEIDIPKDILKLPNINGIGSLPSLHYAMAKDGSGRLKSLIESYQAGTTDQSSAELLTEIMFTWAGVTGDYSPYYQSKIDARKIRTLEAFYGYKIDKPRGSGVQYTALFSGIFKNLSREIGLRLSGTESILFREVKWIQEEKTGNWYGDFSEVADKVIELVSKGTAGAWKETIHFFNTLKLSDDEYSTNQKNLYSYLFESAHSSTADNLPEGFDKLIHMSISQESRVGDEFDNDLFGSSSDDFVYGNKGDDSITVGAGNDFVYGGEGNDTLHGGTGNDRVSGGEGDDHLTVAYSGSNTLDGGAGDDVLTVETPTSSGRYSSYYKTANNARNTLIGGAGNDRLVGGLGAERYEFNRGDGQDTIRDRDVYGSSVDQIVFGEGIVRDELSLRREGNHLVIMVGGPDSGDSITIEEGYVNSQHQIEEIVLSDGSTVSPQSLPILSSAEADELRGGYFADVIDGREGDDRLYGEGGDDTLEGGQGDDVLDGGAGNDTLNAGAGNDTVTAGAGNDVVAGGLGNDTLHGGTGNDQVSGGEGDDHLTVAYSGSNTLDGGAGDDVLTVETPTSSGRYSSYYKTANN